MRNVQDDILLAYVGDEDSLSDATSDPDDEPEPPDDEPEPEYEKRDFIG